MSRIQYAVAVVVFLLVGAAVAWGQETVTVTVQERAGVERIGERVSFGIPLPRAWNVTDVSNLRLAEAGGTALPADFLALARWGGDAEDTNAPIKWVLVDYLETLPASGSKTVRIDRGGPGPLPSPRISVDSTNPALLRIDTGAAAFSINTGGAFNLIHQVSIGGHDLLDPLGPDVAMRYSPVGGQSIVPGGSPDLSPRVTSASVERLGAISAVIKVTGSILDGSSRPVFDFTARLHFVAGRPDVRIDFTPENNHPIVEGEWGQPGNVHEQGAINSVYIGGLELSHRLSGSSELHVLSEQAVDVTSPDGAVTLFQSGSGTEYWNAYVGDVGWPDWEESAEPRLQAYCSEGGFHVSGPGIYKTGDQALGWLSAYRSGGPRMTVAVRNFWQNFPKAIVASPDGTVSVDLFPNGSQYRHNFRVGEEKTHSVLIDFGNGAVDSQKAERLSRAFQRPLFGTAPAAWYVGSGALGRVPVRNLSQWPLYERYVNVAFEPNPDFDPNVDDPSFGNGTLRDAVEQYNLFGWQDYGDVPLDYEAFGPNQAGQMNLKYWYVYGMLTQFARSGDLRWLDLALPSARHLADVDVLHIPDDGPQHWAHGAYFGHSTHDEPGNANPNRNYNSPSVDLAFGVPDLLLAYHLTGEQRFLDVAMELPISMENMSQFSDFSYPVFYRERANLIFAYVEAYRQTGNRRWLDDAEAVIGPTADLSNKGWLASPETYVPPPGGPQEGEERISGFAMGQTVWAMGRYLDFAEEYGLGDGFNVRDALTAYGDFIIDHLMREIPEKPGYYATVDSIWFTAPWETYLEVNTWAFLQADVLAYAYEYSGEQRFLDAADRLYATGSEDQVWLDDPPVYLSSKDLVNALNWGLVYMDATGGASEEAPAPRITAAGGTSISLGVSLAAGTGAGIQADWWLVSATPEGLYYLSLAPLSWQPWLPDMPPTLQAPLLDLGAIDLSGLPGLPGTAGTYTFYFGVDTTMNGMLDGQIAYDSAAATVSAP